MAVLLIVAEVTLRLVWGFGKMPLYAASDKYEYMALPNQSGVRLGNRYYYNAFSMRSDEVNPNVKHILGLGDSVIDGGVQTDQDSLATSLFSAETGMQMLNISAGSWGPDNCAAYLKEKGMFKAKGIFLLVSSMMLMTTWISRLLSEFILLILTSSIFVLWLRFFVDIFILDTLSLFLIKVIMNLIQTKRYWLV